MEYENKDSQDIKIEINAHKWSTCVQDDDYKHHEYKLCIWMLTSQHISHKMHK